MLTGAVLNDRGGGWVEWGWGLKLVPKGLGRGLKCDNSTNEHKWSVLSRVIRLCGAGAGSVQPPPTSSCCCSPSFCFSQKQRQREARLRLPLSLTAMCAALDVCVSLHMSETWKSNRFSVSHCPKPFFSLSPFVSAFVLFAKSPLFFQSKSQVRVDDIFSFFSLFLCLMVICLLCIGQEVERHRVKKKKGHSASGR